MTVSIRRMTLGSGDKYLRDIAVLKIKTEKRTVEAKIGRAVAGFDLTFSAPKSVSVVWALADGGTQGLIYEAHQQALAYVLRYAEQCVFTSRSGKNGVVQEEIRGRRGLRPLGLTRG